MIYTERENKMINAYPEKTTCFCGKDATLKYKRVTNLYHDRMITVTNVPVYECSSSHDKMARVTRVTLRKLLKFAYAHNKSEIEYSEIREGKR